MHLQKPSLATGQTMSCTPTATQIAHNAQAHIAEDYVYNLASLVQSQGSVQTLAHHDYATMDHGTFARVAGEA